MPIIIPLPQSNWTTLPKQLDYRVCKSVAHRRQYRFMISYRGRNPRTVNYLKVIYFDYPEYVPCNVSLMPSTWMKYREELEDIVLRYPRIFPNHVKGSLDFDFSHFENPLYELGRRTDCWGTEWHNVERGLDSHPIGYPLEAWSALDSYAPPDPLHDDLFGSYDWSEVKRDMETAVSRGDLAIGHALPHGFMYMRLFYLRRFENLMIDMATGDPRIWLLIEMVESYNQVVIDRYIDLGAELLSFGDDLGLQKSLPMSPDMWREYIKPSYMRLLAGCRRHDIPVRLHSDGHILEIIPDLLDAGVRLLNPQIRANGLEGLAEMARGKVALHLDLDRQLFPFATPAEIEDHINTVFEGLYLPEGGLMLFAECEPDVSLENIDTICTVLEDVCNLPDPTLDLEMTGRQDDTWKPDGRQDVY